MSVNIYDLNVAKLNVNQKLNFQVDPIAIGINAGLSNQGS